MLESTFYKVWSKRGGAKYTVEATLSGHSGIVYALAWDVGSQTLFSGSQDATIKCWGVGARPPQP